MKVKRREYDRLKAIAETRFRVFVVTGRIDNQPIEQAIMDTTIQDLVLISKFRDPERPPVYSWSHSNRCRRKGIRV